MRVATREQELRTTHGPDFDLLDWVIDQYNAGRSVEEIAAAAGMTSSTLFSWLKGRAVIIRKMQRLTLLPTKEA